MSGRDTDEDSSESESEEKTCDEGEFEEDTSWFEGKYEEKNGRDAPSQEPSAEPPKKREPTLADYCSTRLNDSSVPAKKRGRRKDPDGRRASTVLGSDWPRASSLLPKQPEVVDDGMEKMSTKNADEGMLYEDEEMATPALAKQIRKKIFIALFLVILAYGACIMATNHLIGSTRIVSNVTNSPPTDALETSQSTETLHHCFW